MHDLAADNDCVSVGELSGTLAAKITAACCSLLCLSVPPLALIPFASPLPMATVAVFGLGITFRDGLLTLLGYLLMVGAKALVLNPGS